MATGRTGPAAVSRRALRAAAAARCTLRAAAAHRARLTMPQLEEDGRGQLWVRPLLRKPGRTVGVGEAVVPKHSLV